MGIYTFPKGICPKVNVIARLEYEFVYGKVIKSFVPELRSRKCFSCFGIPMFYVYVIYTNIMNVLRAGMNMSISRIHVSGYGTIRCTFDVFYWRGWALKDNTHIINPVNLLCFMMWEEISFSTNIGMGKVYLKWQIICKNRKSWKMFESRLLNKQKLYILFFSEIKLWILLFSKENLVCDFFF